MGLREKQMGERKRRILDVADTMIRHTGGTEFSMRMLAEMAEVSPATPYNLFGSKEGILSASLDRSLTRTVFEGLDVQSSEPLDFVITASATAVDLLVTQKDLLRPLYQYLLGVVDPVHRPVHIKRSVYYWRTVAETGLSEYLGAQEMQSVDCDTITYMLFAHFLGLLELWIHEDIEDDVFRARAVYGGLLIVTPFIPVEQNAEIQRRLADAKIVLEKAIQRKPRPRKVRKADKGEPEA